ncbi:unnamed protein product [Didymodactylos carnosus]|uniref:Glucose-methanol-choline oxidoreductase N-terminal domain-containing protein n=1 Tax=Didymodactylos carnosus TaxID=1234261 RepID=A0A8S2EBV9_9BILA|nr:unnamed protein product [Didymodactylos carnosus]CAF3870471.1 unnamed protein product [Didymodactylos carnosus]
MPLPLCASPQHMELDTAYVQKTLDLPTNTQEMHADFVIVGGGTAGSIIAARLAEYGYETLLLSSGSNDTTNPLMTQQDLFGQLFQTSRFKHNLFSEPSSNLNNRTMDVVAWNTLGGSGINGGGMERTMTDDWQYFVNATDDHSFAYENMLKYYKKVENFTTSTPNFDYSIHGRNGPIKITLEYDNTFNSVWQNITEEMNETFSSEFIRTNDYGFSFEPTVFTNGHRSWSGDAYLAPAQSKYSNLKVITSATVIKFDVNEETKQINSVLFVTKDGFFVAIAKNEYILSAGTFFSPHILMISGIGDPDILSEKGIHVKHSLKQVGKNLVDNGIVSVEYETKNFSISKCIPVGHIRATNETPNIFFILKNNEKTNRLFVIIFNPSPKSIAGSVSLYNSNPLMSPKIILNYFENEEDMITFVDGIRYIRQIMSTNAMKQFAQFEEILPGSNDEVDYIKNSFIPASHFLGTCSIGKNGEDSVVNNQFKVHGIKNLRIVDASIFPAGFASKTGPCLTVYALAEKAADILRQKFPK